MVGLVTRMLLMQDTHDSGIHLQTQVDADTHSLEHGCLEAV